MKTLLEVQDDLSIARNLVECAFLACEALEIEYGHPLAAVLDAASKHLVRIDVEIDGMKQAAQGGGND